MYRRLSALVLVASLVLGPLASGVRAAPGGSGSPRPGHLSPKPDHITYGADVFPHAWPIEVIPDPTPTPMSAEFAAQLAAAPAESAGSSSDSAIPLDFEAIGQIDGYSTGSWMYHRFEYLGGRALAEVSIVMTSTEGLTMPAGTGFSIYGPPNDRLYAKSFAPADLSAWRADLTSDLPGTYVIEIHNFNMGVRVDYKVRVNQYPPME